jgi:hypothetical protein
MSFASDCRRSLAVGRVRSPGEAAAIMASRRLASGSSGMAVPANRESLPWSSIPREPAASPASNEID